MLLLLFGSAASSGTVSAGAGEVLINGNQPVIKQERTVVVGATTATATLLIPGVGVVEGSDALLLPGGGVLVLPEDYTAGGQVVINGNQPTIHRERTIAVGPSEVLINGNQPTLALERAVAAGASEVLINGNLVTLSTVGGTAVVTVVRADTYGGGLYDRQLELQAEDDLILEVIKAFLKKAA
jgi:hypothetical protein